jgi:hypothetical protein
MLFYQKLLRSLHNFFLKRHWIPHLSDKLRKNEALLIGEEFSDALKKNYAGSAITFDKRAYGFFTLDRFEPTGDLWLFFTGTGIAPYLAMLNNERIWKSFKNISLKKTPLPCLLAIYQTYAYL